MAELRLVTSTTQYIAMHLMRLHVTNRILRIVSILYQQWGRNASFLIAHRILLVERKTLGAFDVGRVIRQLLYTPVGRHEDTPTWWHTCSLVSLRLAAKNQRSTDVMALMIPRTQGSTPVNGPFRQSLNRLENSLPSSVLLSMPQDMNFCSSLGGITFGLSTVNAG